MWIVKLDAGGSENQGIKVLWPYWYIQLFLLKSDQRSSVDIVLYNGMYTAKHVDGY